MPVQTTKNEKRPAREEGAASETVERTVVGWQGIRFTLPPDWNVTSFSMDRDSGYLKVDSPGSGTMSAQVRWSNAAKQEQTAPTLYYFLAPYFRRLLRRPAPALPKSDLKGNLERILKETGKQAKKSKAPFESSLKPEKVEGENGERTAINFTWSGGGRGQGKIWQCAVCNRIVVAQVVGLPKDLNAIGVIASQLFASMHDHAMEGYDLWALYDLVAEVPETFRLEAQKLLSGHLSLTFGRGAEKIVIQRWGLANMALKKFTLEEWFRKEAMVNVKRLARREIETAHGHRALVFEGALPLTSRIGVLRDARNSLRRFPTRYAGGIWECPETNKLFLIQALTNRRSEGLWAEVEPRCVCH